MQIFRIDRRKEFIFFKLKKFYLKNRINIKYTIFYIFKKILLLKINEK